MAKLGRQALTTERKSHNSRSVMRLVNGSGMSGSAVLAGYKQGLLDLHEACLGTPFAPLEHTPEERQAAKVYLKRFKREEHRVPFDVRWQHAAMNHPNTKKGTALARAEL